MKIKSLLYKSFGNTLVWVSLLVTISLWILSKNTVNSIWIYPLISLNQIFALLGTVLFSWSMVLSTRNKLIENSFGGLDKVYHVHRGVSELGGIFLLLHPIFNAVSSPGLFFKWFIPLEGNFTITIGVISFWLFAYLIVATLLIRKLQLPYHIWKHTHKLINVAMIAAFIHIWLIPSDTTIFPLLGYWMYITTGIGVLSGLYKFFLYSNLDKHYSYSIDKITKRDDLYDIILNKEGGNLPHLPGQYVYVSFISENVSPEKHPYCIASQEKEGHIRLVIKELGDHTRSLRRLKVGEKALLYGPYGHISDKYYADDKDAVFIAGGIGIAPFLAMFRSPVNKKSKKQTTLYYCTQYKKDAIFDEEFMKIAEESNKVYYHNQCSREGDGHLEVGEVLKTVKDINNTRFYLCASSKVMESMKKNLLKNGVKSEDIVLEDFDMI